MSFTRFRLAAVLLVALGALPVASADEKDKAKAKAKPPAPSFTDEDLKKYKDKPQDGSGEASTATPAATQPTPSRPSSEGEAQSNRRRRRSIESGGEVGPLPPDTDPGAQPQEPTAAEGGSPEEFEWKGRAAAARRPVDQARGRIAAIEAEMAELKDRLNPMSTSYVLGGNSTAGPGAIYEIEEKLQNLETQRVDAAAEMAEAEKGWQAFLEEARAAGASPAWLNP